MKKPNPFVLRALVAGSLVASSSVAFGAVQTFSWAQAASGTGVTALTGAGAATVSLVNQTAWSNTGDTTSTAAGTDGGINAKFVQQSLANYGSNLAVTTVNGTNTVGAEMTAFETGGSAPNHAMDNNGANEFILFEFSQAVTLTQLSINWPGATDVWGTNSTAGCTQNCVQDNVGGTVVDTQMSVLAYNGADKDTITGANFRTALAGYDSSAAGLANSSLFKAAGIVDPNPNNAVTNIAFDDNGQAAGGNAITAPSSRFWLIGAYNQHLGGGGTAFNDAVKLATFGGKVCSAGTSGANCTPPGGGGGVPEPSSLALAALGLIGGIRRWKRKAA